MILGILGLFIIGIVFAKFIVNKNKPSQLDEIQYPTDNSLPVSGVKPTGQIKNTISPPSSSQGPSPTTPPPSSFPQGSSQITPPPPAPVTSQDSAQAKEDAAAQIRDLDKASEEYNNYNNSANQLNSSNVSL